MRIVIKVVLVFFLLLISSLLSLLLFIRTDSAFLVNRIIDMKRGDDSPWDFSFEEIAEKEGRIIFKGFSLSYDEDMLCYIEEGSVDLSLSALYSFWKNENSSVTAVINGGSIDLNMILSAYADYKTRDKKEGFSFYDFIIRRNVSLSGGSLSVDYDYLISTIENIELEYTSSDEVFSGSFSAPLITSSFSGMTEKAEGASISFVRDGNIKLNAVLDTIRVEDDGITGYFKSVLFEEETASVSAFLRNDYTGKLTLSEASLSQDGLELTLSDGTFSYSDNLLSGSFVRADASGFGAQTNAEGISLSFTTESSYLLSCESMTAIYASRSTLITNASVEGRLDGDAAVTIENILSDFSDITGGKIGKAEGTNLTAAVTKEDGYKVVLSGDVEAETKGESLDDITFSFTADAFSDEDGAVSGRVEIDSLYPGFGTMLTSPLIIEKGEESVTATIESETVNADIIYDPDVKDITGNVTLSALPVKTALEFLLDKDVEKLSGKSVIDMTSSFALSYEDGEITGSALFDITLSSYRISFFTFVVGINGGVEIDDGKMVLDGVRFTSPILSFGVEGWYDFVTGKPHFSFTK